MPSEPRNTVAKRFAKASASATVQLVSFQGTTLLANIVLARLFGPAVYGLFTAGLQTLNGAGQVAQLATGSVGSRFVGQTIDHDRNLALAVWGYCRKIGLISGFVISVLLFLAAPYVAQTIYRQPELEPTLRFAGISIFFVVASQQVLQVLSSIEAVRTVAIASICAGVAYLVATIFGGYTAGPLGAMVGVTLSYAILWGILAKPEREKLPRAEAAKVPPSAELEGELAKIRKQLLPASLSGLLLLPSTWMLLAVVSNNRGAAEAGLFGAATQLRVLLMILPQILNSAGLVLVNRTVRAKSSATADRLAAITLVGSSVLCALLGLVAAPLTSLVFGSKFTASIGILTAFLPAIVLESVILLVRQRMQRDAEFWQWLGFIVVPWQGVTILAAYFLVPVSGAYGAAYSYSIGLGSGLVGFLILYGIKKMKGKEITS